MSYYNALHNDEDSPSIVDKLAQELIWRSSSGPVLISQMSDEHLQNAINKLARTTHGGQKMDALLRERTRRQRNRELQAKVDRLAARVADLEKAPKISELDRRSKATRDMMFTMQTDLLALKAEAAKTKTETRSVLTREDRDRLRTLAEVNLVDFRRALNSIPLPD